MKIRFLAIIPLLFASWICAGRVSALTVDEIRQAQPEPEPAYEAAVLFFSPSFSVSYVPVSLVGDRWKYRIDWKRKLGAKTYVYINGRPAGSGGQSGSVESEISASSSVKVELYAKPGKQGLLTRKYFKTLPLPEAAARDESDVLGAGCHFLSCLPGSATSSAISIQGDEYCKAKTQAAFAVLRQKSPKFYADVEKYIGVVECVPSGSGVNPAENPVRFRAGKITLEADTVWYAGTLVHDATHSKLYQEYFSAHPSQPVPADVWTGPEAESACLQAQAQALSDMGADAATVAYVKSLFNTGYWNDSNRKW